MAILTSRTGALASYALSIMVATFTTSCGSNQVVQPPVAQTKPADTPAPGKPTKSCGAGGCGGEVSKAAEEKPVNSCGAGGCGGKVDRPATEKPLAHPLVPVPKVSGPSKPWASMTRDEREAHMLEAVYPTMESLALSYDDKRFKEFACETCHGQDAADVQYRMPNPQLYKVYPTGSAEQKEMVEKHQDILVFMFNTVVPAMTQLLGQPEYDETTQKGLSCFSCHPRGTPGT